AVVDGEVEAAAVGCPGEAGDVAVQVGRHLAHPTAVDPDHVDLCDVVRLVRPVRACEEDVPAVGGDDGAGPVPLAVGELPDLAGLDVDGVDRGLGEAHV